MYHPTLEPQPPPENVFQRNASRSSYFKLISILIGIFIAAMVAAKLWPKDALYSDNVPASAANADPASSVSGTAAARDVSLANASGISIRDSGTSAAVKARLLWDSRVRGLSIDVDTVRGTVYLSGQVSTEAERTLIQKLVQDVVPPDSIQNRVKVAHSAGLSRTDHAADLGAQRLIGDILVIVGGCLIVIFVLAAWLERRRRLREQRLVQQNLTPAFN